MNTKQIFRNMLWKAAGAMALRSRPPGLVSCDDDDTSGGGAYFRLEEMTASKYISNASELGFDIQPIIGDETAVVAGYVVRSNRKWTVECNSDDAEWLRIFPKAGENEGRFWVCAKDNDFTSPRSTTLVFRYADGSQTETTIAVRQLANIPYIDISLAENGTPVDAIEAEHAAKSYDVTVSSNIDYFYTPDQDGWFTFTELGHGSIGSTFRPIPKGRRSWNAAAASISKAPGSSPARRRSCPCTRASCPTSGSTPRASAPPSRERRPSRRPSPSTRTTTGRSRFPKRTPGTRYPRVKARLTKSSTVTITPEANNS